MTDWRPAASGAVLQQRAVLLARMRDYFAREHVLEVDTPALSHAAVTSPQLASFRLDCGGSGAGRTEHCWLHTSPEFPMKRLLAAGSGSIYQLCKVFRAGEAGRLHNPEFTLLEWYRTGFDHLDLMDDVERLLRDVLAGIRTVEPVSHWTWRDLYLEFAGIDPFAVTVPDLQRLLGQHGFETVGMQQADLQAWLDLVMTHLVEPRLGRGLVFVRDYPASQAALARIRPGNPALASRFEAYLDGIELANGFHELSDAAEQRKRFETENRQRVQAGLPAMPVDEYLLAALDSGLPDCAGVALGVDRLLMLAAGADSIGEVLAFPFARS